MTNLATLLPASVTDDIDLMLGGPRLKMTYDPRQIVGNNETPADDDDAPITVVFALARSICTVVTAWELVGPVPMTDLADGTKQGSAVPEGEPVPLDPLVVSLLPTAILQGIVAGLAQHNAPNPSRTAKGSPKRG